jgi:uncharacterized protein (TIGR02246 family)
MLHASRKLPRHVEPLRLVVAGLGLTFAVLAAGCSEASGTPTEARTVETAQTSTSQDEGIAGIVAAATAAWTAKDAAAYAAIYSEDAVMTNPVGARMVGREAIRAGHAFLFSGPFAGSTQTITVVGVRYLTGTIAIVDQDVRLTGYAFLPPNGLRATTPGVVRTSVSWVVMKRGGTWEIVAQNMTPIPPAP